MVKRHRKRHWYNIPGHMADMSKTGEGRCNLVMILGGMLSVFAFGGLYDRTFWTPTDVTPESQRFGWNEVAAKQEAPRIAAQLPAFAIRDNDGNIVSGAGKNSELWKFTKLANGGKHIATWRQESGDCVSMGWSNAIAYRQGFQIAQEQRNEILKIPFPPYMYGVSRVQIGKRQLGRGAGSVGAWAAQGSISYGVYPCEQAEQDGFKYSGGLADNWGWNGAPAGPVKFAKDFRIKTVSQVRSWEDARDALVHGYPVTVASNVGFTGPFVVRDGKKWGTARGQWGHQMCFIGCEDRPGRDKGCYVINSWGLDAHPKPLNDEPPGGFWVTWQTVQNMVAQGDSWAYSDFDGFPADATANWNAFKQDKIEQAADGNREAELLARVEQPEVEPVLKEVRVMFSPSLLSVLLCIGLAAFLGALYWKHKSTRLTCALLLAATLIYGSANVDAGRRHRVQYYSQSVCSCAPGVCANGQCALAGCVNGQCATANCANGQCKTGYVRPANKPYNPNAGLLPETKSGGVEVASTSPTAVFNAFKSQEPIAPQVWNAMPIKPAGLRTYADCWRNEKEFVLVVGPESDALMTLETTDKPVAWVASHREIKPGTYRVFMDAGRLAYTSLAKTSAVLQSAVSR